LALLIVVNLHNYTVRQIPAAVFPLIKVDLHLSDSALGLLGSAFMVCYMVSAPLFGWLGDRRSRAKLAAIGLTVWSLAIVLAEFATGYRALLLALIAVGIGSASFVTVSPGLLADYFPREKRGRVMAYFFLAIPVGSALGYVLGGNIGHHFGWRAAFLVVSLPGLLFALPLWFLREPNRVGEVPIARNRHEGTTGYASLFRNRSFVTTTLAMAAMTFAFSGLGQWVPTFLFRMHGLDAATGNTLFGAITVITGITGTLTGGWLGDRIQKKSGKGYLLVSGWGFLLGTPAVIYALLAQNLTQCLAAMFLAEFFLFLNIGPLNTIVINVTKPEIRSMAFAVNTFFIHALGGAIAPIILGWLSDLWGLRLALLAAPLAILLAAFFSFFCIRTIESDMANSEE